MDLAAIVTGEVGWLVQAGANLAVIVGGLKYGLAGLERRCDRIEAKVDSLGTQGSAQGERIARLEAQGDRHEARDKRVDR